MPLTFETVAIPVVAGIDVNTSARLVQPTNLLEAINTRFPRGSGAQKRRGHLSARVRGEKSIPPGVSISQLDPPGRREPYSTADMGLPKGWLWGWGILNAGVTDLNSALTTSEHPAAGLIFGVAQRDNEVLLWDGFRLFSRAPGQTDGAPLPTHNAVMPALRASAIAKSNRAQGRPDIADTGRIRVVAWVEDGVVFYTVLDSGTGGTILPATALPVEDTAKMRVLNVGQWCHILVAHSAGLLHRFSVNADTPRDYSQVSLGVCETYFDAWKVSETLWVVARNTGTGVAISWHETDGTADIHHVSSTPALGVSAVGNLALSVHPVTKRIGLVYVGDTVLSTSIWFLTLDEDGTPRHSPFEVAEVNLLSQLVTVAPTYLTGTAEIFNVYWEHDNRLHIRRVEGAAGYYAAFRHNLTLASNAFRVGNRTFVWVGKTSQYQTTWFLLDEALNPVGHMDYITANVEPGHLASVNWRGTMDAKDRLVFHGGLGFRVRVAAEAPSTKSNIPVVYADPSIRFYELDFLPPLRTAQAGRTTYFAGAQLWAYDGLGLSEANFPLAPEGVTMEADGTLAGDIEGEHIWRVDLCYRNAQNEEIRSASFYTEAFDVPAGKKVTLTIPTVFTAREDAYFLIFRNENIGAQWYLVNSRDPSSPLFVLNDQSQASVTFVDNGIDTPNDAVLVGREMHPANGGFGYLDVFPAPACEVIAAGHDRLWVAGGEIPAGQVHPSRLYIPGETPGFNAFLAVQVDRAAEPITAIGFVGDLRAYFRKTQTYVHSGVGPDNSSAGAWEPVRLAYADVGAVSPSSLGLITAGLLFQSPAGIRLLTPGGGLQSVGQPVDRLAKNLHIKATLVCGEDQEVRFYSDDGDALVFNYQFNAWSTWTLRAAGVARDPSTGLAILAQPTGDLWSETEGLWLDDGQPYKHRIRFAWLRAGNLVDFQRVRRIGAIGECAPGESHMIHVDVYYDEREFAEEWFDWEYPDENTQNTDFFGAGTFGDGAFGDTED